VSDSHTDISACRDADRPHWIAGVEVAIVFILLLILIWEPWRLAGWKPYAAYFQTPIFILCGAVVLISWLRAGDRWSSLAIGHDRWLEGVVPLAGFTLVGLVALALGGLALNSLSIPKSHVLWLARYIPALVAQQIALQVFVNNRVYEATSSMPARQRARIAVAGSTFAFAALHAPNPWLVVITAIGGAFWTWHFRRYQNLLGLIVSHLVLGVGALVMLGEGPLLGLRVGWPAMRRLLHM